MINLLSLIILNCGTQTRIFANSATLLNSFSYPVIKEVLNYHPLTLVYSSYSLLPLNNKWDAVLGRSAWKCTKQRHYVTNSLGPAILLTVNFTCRGMLCHKVGILRRLLLHRCNQITRQTKFTGHVVIILPMYLPKYQEYDICINCSSPFVLHV